jgi:hypothetical protein
MSNGVLTTGIIGDLHSGSNVSLMHPRAFNTHGERNVEMNSYQERLWDFWKTEIVPNFKNIDCLVLNGDLCELMQPRNRMTETWSGDPLDQVVNVLRLIDMIKPKKCFVVKGTPYHIVDGALHVEELVGKFLNTGIDEKDLDDKYSYNIPKITDCVKYRGRYAYEYRLIDLSPKNGKPQLFHITHHMGSTGAWQYRGTAPSKAMATLMLNESHFIDRNTWKRIKGIIRNHVHHYWYEESANRMMIVNPCFQYQTPFMFKTMPESVPDIGAVKLEVYSDGTIIHRPFLQDSDNIRPPVFRAI